MLTIFAGGDDFRRKLSRDRYLVSILPSSEWQQEVARLEGDKMSLDGFRTSLDHGSLFGDGVKVIVEKAEKMDKAKEKVALESSKGSDIELILDYSSGVPPKSLAESAKVFWAKPFKPAEAADWVMKEWNTQNHKPISYQVAEYLVARTGHTESGPLWQELNKIAEWSVAKEINIEAIEKAGTLGGLKTPWKFYDLVAERKAAEAFGELEGLLLSPEWPGVRLVMGLTSHLLGITESRIYIDTKTQLRAEGWMGEKWRRQAANWKKQELDHALWVLLKADLALKKGASEEGVMKLVVLEMARGGSYEH